MGDQAERYEASSLRDVCRLIPEAERFDLVEQLPENSRREALS